MKNHVKYAINFQFMCNKKCYQKLKQNLVFLFHFSNAQQTSLFSVYVHVCMLKPFVFSPSLSCSYLPSVNAISLGHLYNVIKLCVLQRSVYSLQKDE